MGRVGAAHPRISLEDFLYYYHIAYERNNIRAMNQLSNTYSDLSDLAFRDKISHSDADAEDDFYSLHPVVCGSNRMTERHVLDLVAYLQCREEAPREYKDKLRTAHLSYRRVFNYGIDRYQKDYDRGDLWENFFLQQSGLRQVIKHRRISSMEELEYRAAEYFESHARRY